MRKAARYGRSGSTRQVQRPSRLPSHAGRLRRYAIAAITHATVVHVHQRRTPPRVVAASARQTAAATATPVPTAMGFVTRRSV